MRDDVKFAYTLYLSAESDFIGKDLYSNGRPYNKYGEKFIVHLRRRTDGMGSYICNEFIYNLYINSAVVLWRRIKNMATIDWSKEQITPEKFFDLPREERLKIIIRHVPFRVKVPFFVVGVLGVLTNCLVSAFAGTTVHNIILTAGNTEFTARFWSLALALFSLQALNSGMDRASKWMLDKLYVNGKKS